MDKELLIKVLSTSSRVVLPGFGAFLRKVQGEHLIFSPFLKSDDGFLISYVAQEYGVSQDDATAMVGAFVEHIREVLSVKSKFYIDGVGTLLVDDNGSIVMVMDISRQIGAAPVQPAPIVEPAMPTMPTNPAQSVAPQMVTPQPISAPRAQFVPPQQVAPQPLRPTTAAPSIGGFARAVNSSVPPIAAQPQGAAFRANPTVLRADGANIPPNQGDITNSNTQGAGDAHNAHNGAPQEHGVRPNLPQQRPIRRPVTKGAKKAKADIWLVIAIVAALVVIGIMIFGFLTNQQANNLQL